MQFHTPSHSIPPLDSLLLSPLDDVRLDSAILFAVQVYAAIFLGKQVFLEISAVISSRKMHRSRFWGRGRDEALFSEKKGFSVKRGEAIQ